ncbi:hypothetical protein LINPERHAP1_LOCUS4713, partial [Linum perenne]
MSLRITEALAFLHRFSAKTLGSFRRKYLHKSRVRLLLKVFGRELRVLAENSLGNAEHFSR